MADRRAREWVTLQATLSQKSSLQKSLHGNNYLPPSTVDFAPSTTS